MCVCVSIGDEIQPTRSTAWSGTEMKRVENREKEKEKEKLALLPTGIKYI